MAEPAQRLMPPSSSLLERSLDAASARVGDVPVPLRTLWNPETCPENLLPWLAWALSIKTWRSTWPEHIKRARIRHAIAIHRHKGTRDSIEKIIASFGGEILLREWWEKSPPGAPHTFDLAVTLSDQNDVPVTAEFVDDVVAEIWRTKPVRSHFTFTQGLLGGADVRLTGAARGVLSRRLTFVEA